MSELDTSIMFALQAHPSSRQQWIDVARSAEAAGFDALCIGDHPGLTCSPFVALAAAAVVTDRIQLGTAVVNGGVRQPLDVASDVATLDFLSDGRAFLGIGAGHTPAEWEAIGLQYPTPTERINRFAELLATIPRLIARKSVTFSGDHVRLRDAALAFHAARAVPIVVGGGNPRLLRLGAELADVVEVSGLGRTLPGGHYHEIRWSEADVDRVTGIVWETAADTARHPVLSAMVQHVDITDDAEGAASRYLDRLAAALPPEALPTVADALASPYTLIGTVSELVTKLHSTRDRWGITRYTVRSLEPVTEVIDALNTPNP